MCKLDGDEEGEEDFGIKINIPRRKLLNFENGTNGEPRQLAKIRGFKVDYFNFSCIKLEKLV